MMGDIIRYVKKYPKCQVIKTWRQKPAGFLQPILPHSKLFTKLTLDYLGLLSISNRKSYILVATSTTTRFTIVKAMEKSRRTNDSKIYSGRYFTKLWYAGRNTNRLGTYFVAESLKQLYKTLGWLIKLLLHIGHKDRVWQKNITLPLLICYVNENQSDWYKYVKLVTLVYNSGLHASTGRSPLYLLHSWAKPTNKFRVVTYHSWSRYIGAFRRNS